MKHSRTRHAWGIVSMLTVLTAAGTGITMALWNAVLPSVTGVSLITYWQALGLLALGLTLSGAMLIILAILMHAFHPNHQNRRKEVFRKWNSMTDEQRKAFLASHGLKIENDN